MKNTDEIRWRLAELRVTAVDLRAFRDDAVAGGQLEKIADAVEDLCVVEAEIALLAWVLS